MNESNSITKHVLPPNEEVIYENKKLFATATSVQFIDDNNVLVASYLGRCIYIGQLDPWLITKRINTHGCPDLIDYKDGRIMAICFPHGPTQYSTVEFFDLGSRSLISRRAYDSFKLHGGRVIDKNYFVVLSTYNEHRGVWYNGLGPKWDSFKGYPKSIWLLTNGNILLVTSSSASRATLQESILYLFDKDRNILDCKIFYGQADDICVEDDIVYVTNLQCDRIEVFTLAIPSKIVFINQIHDYNVPHGLAIRNGLLAVTNYGDNTLELRKVGTIDR